jgi:hypothetical protein
MDKVRNPSNPDGTPLFKSFFLEPLNAACKKVVLILRSCSLFLFISIYVGWPYVQVKPARSRFFTLFRDRDRVISNWKNSPNFILQLSLLSEGDICSEATCYRHFVSVHTVALLSARTESNETRESETCYFCLVLVSGMECPVILGAAAHPGLLVRRCCLFSVPVEFMNVKMSTRKHFLVKP